MGRGSIGAVGGVSLAWLGLPLVHCGFGLFGLDFGLGCIPVHVLREARARSGVELGYSGSYGLRREGWATSTVRGATEGSKAERRRRGVESGDERSGLGRSGGGERRGEQCCTIHHISRPL